MFLINSYNRVRTLLGRRQKNRAVLLCGLDGAGKSSLIQKLKDGQATAAPPPPPSPPALVRIRNGVAIGRANSQRFGGVFHPKDWKCRCDFVNWARRQECRECGLPRFQDVEGPAVPAIKKLNKSIGTAAAYNSGDLYSADDWQCSGCNNINWSSRPACHECNSLRYQDGTASQELSIGSMRITIFYFGHHRQAREIQVYKDHFPAVNAIVFMVDASDREKFPESREELNSLLADEDLSNCPVLILGNKIDRLGAASEDELRAVFNLDGLTTGKERITRARLNRRPLEIFMSSVIEDRGYQDGLLWLENYI